MRVALKLLAVAGLILVAAAAYWAWPREHMLRPYIRFIDPQSRPTAGEFINTPSLADGETTKLPVASLLNDSRYVLEALAHEALVFAEKVTVKPDGTVSFFPALPVPLRQAKRLMLVPQIEIGTEWRKLPTFEATPELADGTPRVRVKVHTAGAAPGDTVGIHVEGIVIPDTPSSEQHTPAVRIPKGAVLTFAIGLPRAAWSQGAVFFSIKACAADLCEPIFEEVLDPTPESGHGWHDRRVSLASFVGSRRSFVFSTRVLSGATQAFSLPLWANPTVYVPARRRYGDVNVILLSIDTLSAQHLPSYGSHNDTAPFIADTFGRNGTVFDHCVAASVTTPPSHMTMLTGVPPCVHGLTTGLENIPSWLVTVAEQLRGAGFETGAVTEDGWLGTSHGFGRGFNSYAENTSPDVMQPQGQVDVTFAKAKDWLRLHRDQRFFLFLHTFQVHDPYSPPPAYATLFTTVDGQPITDASPRPVRDVANYDREIRYTDDELRQLFDALRENGLEHNTIFILTADHGEEFFEHGAWGHGTDFYEETTHVPLMLWGPGRIAARRISAPVGHVDFMPSIMELAGVACPKQAMGRSFIDLLGGSGASRDARPYFVESWGQVRVLPDYTTALLDRPGYMIQLGLRKLSRYRQDGRDRFELYDLTQDAAEHTNLYTDADATLATLRAPLEAYVDECQRVASRFAAGLPAAGGEKPPGVQLSPAEEEKLRALGYLK